MSEHSLLCDTNVLIHLLNGNVAVADFLNQKNIFISFITELELYGKRMNPPQLSIIKSLIDNCIVIEVRQMHTIKLPDAIIAATAMYYDVPLVTFDTDFQNINELKLILFKF